MFNWNSSHRTTSFRYVRVKWPTFAEMGVVGDVTDCTIDESLFTSLKATGSLDYINLPDIGDDMIRVYSDSILGDKKATVCHGTFFVSTPSGNISEGIKTGTAQMYSTLLVMRQNKFDETYTVEKGKNIIDAAKALVTECKLNAVTTPSDKVTSTAHSWDAGTEYLEIANDLMEMAGYDSLSVSPYGDAIISPAVDLSEKVPAVTISDTEDSVGARSFSHELDTYDVPNVVTVTFTNADNDPMTATAVNDDPENPYSTVSRGKRIVRHETVDEIANQKALNEKAQELLKSSMMPVESIEIPHAYLPFNLGDAVMFDYRRSNMVMKMSAANRTTKMTPSITCETRIRRFVNLLEDK